MELKSRIRALRERLGITQQEFASRVGTSQKVISRWESGVTPRERMLRKIAEVGGVPYEWLAFGDTHSTGPTNLSDDEARILELYRGLSDRRFRYELLERLELANDHLAGAAEIKRRVPTIFYDKDAKAQERILEPLLENLRDYYDELATVEAERRELDDDQEASRIEQDIISYLDQKADEIRRQIRALQRCNRETAIREVEYPRRYARDMVREFLGYELGTEE